MKAMNEFESVVAIAALILAACAILDLPFGAPAGAGSKPAGAYPESTVAHAIELVQRETPEAADNSTPSESASASRSAADGGQTPALLMQALR